MYSNKSKYDLKNPLKKSTTFLRSSSRSRLDESIKNSLENSNNSMKDTIDFKFSGFKIKK